MFNKWWGLILVLDIILLGFVVWYVAGAQKVKDKAEPETKIYTEEDLIGQIDYSLGPPAEVGENFNPTETAALFRIEAVSAESLRLRAIWPNSFAGLILTSRIACDEVKMVEQAVSQKEKLVSQKDFFAEINSLELKRLIFSGLCAAPDCQIIETKCQLFIYPQES